VNEFELIELVKTELGSAACGEWVRTGPGDDSAVTAVPPGMDLVSSIDALVGGVHFPVGAGAELVGYRALMVSASDLAAMGAVGGFALVALSLEGGDADWLRLLTRGLRRAAADAGLAVVGGNLARGPLTITVSVHGYVPVTRALLRSGARNGDDVFVTGTLGAAAAAWVRGGLDDCSTEDDLDELSRHYFLPRARIVEGQALRGFASSAIDVSDGLLQDLGHVCAASRVGVELESASVPVARGATLEQALRGGDDYELCFTGRGTPPKLDIPVHRIGRVVEDPGVRLDGRPAVGGYQHFGL
jgi:thiamine-monophosphate kinase